MKLWWAEIHTGHAGTLWIKPGAGADHNRLNSEFALRDSAPTLGRKPMVENDWFRWAFVRNPWARLVSAFANKFVNTKKLPGAKKLVELHRVRHPRRSWTEQLRSWLRAGPSNSTLPSEFTPDTTTLDPHFTFRNFVETLSTLDLHEGNVQVVDVHWMPQYRFLGTTQFHFLGRFERLAADMETVANRLGVPVHLPAPLNQTKYSEQGNTREVYADWPASALKEQGTFPEYRQFYTHELVKLVAKLYERDISQFGYDF